ncbi:MAG TPA: AI-2E family transporter [Candidatus Acidoferrales bacterium]|nr:AI-2E family transporter [Candidatus Acidoferrales bacterium]
MAENTDYRFNNFLFYGVILCLTYLVFRVFEPFLIPLGWAAVFAVLFHSLNKRFERKWGSTQAAGLITLGVTLILIIPVLLIAVMFVREGISAAGDIQRAMGTGHYGWFGKAWAWIGSKIAAQGIRLDLRGLVREEASNAGGYMAAKLGGVIRNIVVFLFELLVTLFALFYFIKDGDAILTGLRNFLPFEETMKERMLAEARELIFASVTTSVVIAVVQGLICGVAFAIVGLGSPVFWGVVMAFLSLLPVVGAWPVWVPATIWLFSSGHAGRAVILVIICGAVGGMVDNVLRPVLLGGRASLNGLLVFISVLGGIAVFGVLGVILGPIVVATAVGILDVYSGVDEADRVPNVPAV